MKCAALRPKSPLQQTSEKSKIWVSKKNCIFEKMNFMAEAFKYMVDEKGDKTSVLVPIKTWEKINGDYKKLQNKLKVLTGIKEGFAEVKEAKRTGKKLQTLKEFLRESNG